MNKKTQHERAYNAASTLAQTVTALTEARRANRAIERACELFQPAESPDDNGYPGCLTVKACPWNDNIKRVDWCETCLSTSIPDLRALKLAKRRATATVLRIGREQ
jgi:hypothetical protein